MSGETVLWSRSIKMTTYEKLHTNQNQFYTVGEIKEGLVKTQKWLKDIDCVKWLAFSNGLDGKIMQSIHSLKEDGHFIVSSDEHGKGYSYLDPNNDNTPNAWDSMFFANEKREDVPKVEKDMIKELFKKSIEQCTNPKVRNQMIKIAIKYRIKKENE